MSDRTDRCAIIKQAKKGNGWDLKWRHKRKKRSGRKKSSTRSKKKQSASFRLEITGVILIAIGVIGLLQLGFVGRGFLPWLRCLLGF